MCERCLKAGRVRAAEFIHHKEHLDINNYTDPTVTLSFDNLEALCRGHHAAEHSKKRYYVDEDGEVYMKPGGGER